MQSFIINIPDEKVDFFLELAEMLDFEVLEIDEDQFEIEEEDDPKAPPVSSKKTANNKEVPPDIDDPFLDWDAERKNAKKNKY